MSSNQILKNFSSFFFFLQILSPLAVQAAGPVVLKAAWSASPATRPLKSWTLEDLSQLKVISSSEKDPETGQLIRWKGVLISKWIEKELAEIPLEERSQVDLIIFKNEKGQQAIIPRYLLNKYPVMLGFERGPSRSSVKSPHNDEQKSETPTLTVVVPWTSKPKILKENLPLEAYQISDVNEVFLSSFAARFNSLLLKRRTDPAAIRGEKMVVQNCVGCHGSGRARPVSDLLHIEANTFGHPQGEGVPKLNTRDVRAFVSYLAEYRSEKGLVGQQVGNAKTGDDSKASERQ